MKQIFVLLITFMLVSCSSGPSLQEIQTAMAQTETAKPTATNTNTPLPTLTFTPRPTRTPIPTRTLIPTKIPRPTSTPKFGSFASPVPFGVSIVEDTGLNFKPGYGTTMAATVVDVKRGEEARSLAKQEITWLSYEEPIEGQEYLAVQIKYEVIKAKENEPFTLYRGWHVALRYRNDDALFWPVEYQLYAGTPVEKYPPFDATLWVFFLIKKDTTPMLYFQPMLFIVEEAVGDTSSGSYLRLEK